MEIWGPADGDDGCRVGPRVAPLLPLCPTANSLPDFVYEGLGGFGILRHPPTQDQATHPEPPDPHKHLRGGGG